MAQLRTLVIKLLRKTNAQNWVAQTECFLDSFKQLLSWLKKINFL